MKFGAHAVLTTTLCGLLATPAAAATDSFYVYAGDMGLVSPSSFDAGLIVLPNLQLPGFIVRFTLPANYVKNTPVNLRLRFSLLDACQIKLSLGGVRRFRIGKVVQASASGIKFNGGMIVSAAAAVSSSAKTITVTGLTSGAITGMKASDTVLLNIERDDASIDDTCPGSVYLEGAEVIYSRN